MSNVQCPLSKCLLNSQLLCLYFNFLRSDVEPLAHTSATC